MRTPIIAGNWKMFKTVQESVDFVKELAPRLAPFDGVEMVVCPTFVALVGVADALKGTGVRNIDMPLLPDRVYEAITQRHDVSGAPPVKTDDE